MCILKCVPVSRSLTLSPSLILSLFSVSFCACFPLSKAAAKFQCTQLAQWDKYRFACNETNITSESQWREGNRESEIKRKERSKKEKKLKFNTHLIDSGCSCCCCCRLRRYLLSRSQCCCCRRHCRRCCWLRWRCRRCGAASQTPSRQLCWHFSPPKCVQPF